MTPLIIAARADKHDIARLLLVAGGHPRAALKDGGTALLAASYKGHLQVR